MMMMMMIMMKLKAKGTRENEVITANISKICRCLFLVLLSVNNASGLSSGTRHLSSRGSSLFNHYNEKCHRPSHLGMFTTTTTASADASNSWTTKTRITSYRRRLPFNPLLRRIVICYASPGLDDTLPTDDTYDLDNDVDVDVDVDTTSATTNVVQQTAQTILYSEGQYPPPLVQFQPLNTSRDPDIGGAYNLIASASIGVLAGFAVVLFKLSIEKLREILYLTSFIDENQWAVCIIPVLGGVGVSLLATFGEFPPGLRGTINEIDSNYLYVYKNANSPNPRLPDWQTTLKNTFRYITKPLAAICTLGTGCSLGPEGPSVELGMTVSRIFMFLTPPSFLSGGQTESLDAASIVRRNRLFLSVGAAAGLSAGFNAPLSGVFFALEIVQQALPIFTVAPSSPSSPSSMQSSPSPSPSPSPLDQDSIIDSELDSDGGGLSDALQTSQQEYFSSGSESIAPLLLASVISALVSQIFLGDSLALSLPPFDFNDPLIELPLYLLLGVMSGVVATLFSVTAQFSKEVFDGDAGPDILKNTMSSLPTWSKPIIGGLTCGIVGIFFPQILFFGYDTLNKLLANESLPSDTIATLFVVKTFTTAVSAGSGLVGGTFAPSLFLGGMLGAFFHNTIESLLQVQQFGDYRLAEVPAYAMVGAASVLAALFRAPLTASLLLFETTRDYGVLLPLMASAGIGGLVGDTVERVFEERKTRDKDAVSWGDLADDDDSFGDGTPTREEW